MTNGRKFWELKEESENRKKDGNESLLIEHNEEIQVIFLKSLDLPISSILNNSMSMVSG